MPDWSRRRRGFSLVELMIVIVLIGILAGIVLPQLEPAVHDQLEGVAQTVASDLAYARSLAVTGGSSYRVHFDQLENRCVLTHIGANALLDTLPPSPFRSPTDPPDKHITDLDELPLMGPTVWIATVRTEENSPQEVENVRFGPLGETVRAKPTVIWLACSGKSDRRFIPLTVDPITGLVSIGGVRSASPPDIAP